MRLSSTVIEHIYLPSHDMTLLLLWAGKVQRAVATRQENTNRSHNLPEEHIVREYRVVEGRESSRREIGPECGNISCGLIIRQNSGDQHPPAEPD